MNSARPQSSDRFAPAIHGAPAVLAVLPSVLFIFVLFPRKRCVLGYLFVQPPGSAYGYSCPDTDRCAISNHSISRSFCLWLLAFMLCLSENGQAKTSTTA